MDKAYLFTYSLIFTGNRQWHSRSVDCELKKKCHNAPVKTTSHKSHILIWSGCDGIIMVCMVLWQLQYDWTKYTFSFLKDEGRRRLWRKLVQLRRPNLQRPNGGSQATICKVHFEDKFFVDTLMIKMGCKKWKWVRMLYQLSMTLWGRGVVKIRMIDLTPDYCRLSEEELWRSG